MKKKSKTKADSKRDKPPVSSKRAAASVVTKPPEPAPTAHEVEDHDERFAAVKAENLFDISEGEEETPEGQNGDEKERFFQPEDNNDDSEDEDAKTDSKKQAKRQREKEDENSSESEEEKDENHPRLMSTAVSSFKKGPRKESKKEVTRQETGPKEEEGQRVENKETVEKEKEQDDEDEDEDEDEEEEDEEEEEEKEKEEKEEEDEEPRVEFAGDTKPEVRICFYWSMEITFQVPRQTKNHSVLDYSLERRHRTDSLV